MAEEREESQPQAGATTEEAATEFVSFMQGAVKARTDEQKERIRGAVDTLAGECLKNAGLVSDNAEKSIKSVLAEVDERLTKQVNLILHHEEFQELEKVYDIIRSKVAEGSTILFVGTKRQAQETIQMEAERCGMPFRSVKMNGFIRGSHLLVR